MPERARRAIALALLLVGAPAAADDGRALPLWRVDGAANSVYLLGSVHLLRESDYPIPEAIYEAYEEAETLVMELDMDDLDPAVVQSLVTELGVIQGGGSLESLLGAEAFGKAREYANTANIPLGMLSQLEPWFAAVSVEQMVLARVGFDPDYGIEAHLAARADEDGKEIIGLETTREQLTLLDGLPLEAQRSLLLQTLEESVEIAEIMDEVVRAWRHGDVEYLERVILEDFREHRELYDAVVVTRNRAWTEQIDDLLEADDDYLVVVGALHLIGGDGVPAMLEKKGRQARQQRSAGF